MPRLADALERESRSVDLEQGDFERLLGRRERKERNRRIRAGALGVIVALAMGFVFVRSLTSEPVPADPPVEPTPAAPTGAGEVLTPMGGLGTFPRGSTDLDAQDPDSGEVRTIVDAKGLPESAESITGAAWSPDRRWVAFRAGGLWVADTIGGAPVQLTADQGWFPWAWSPTEGRLAVVHGHDVTLVDAATGRETDLGTVVGPEDSEGYAVHNLVWSPDGTRIAYDGGPGWGSVYSIDVQSGEHSLLVRQPAGTGEITDIDPSPDGAHLAISYVDASYIANHKAELGPIWYKATALYLANADGSDLRRVDRIVASEWGVWHPGTSVGTAWSPDGTRLAYSNFSGPDHRELQVWTVSVDGSAPSLIASHCCVSDGGGPVWSPDGSQIAFETENGGGTPDVRLGHLVVNADGAGDPTEIDELTYLSWLDGWYFCRCYG
jgi:Tol biopolymer transport system component